MPGQKMNTPHWHILGAGAIGCVFAQALHRSGSRASLVLRDTRADIEVTLHVTHQGAEQRCTVPVFSRANDSRITHLLITTKAYDVYSALAQCARFLAPNCQILLLVNGMGMAQTLREEYPQHRIFCGTTTAGAYRENPGTAPFHIEHAAHGETRIGMSGHSDVPDWFDAFARALKHCVWDENIDAALWAKLAVNGVINPLTAVHGCRNGDLATHPELAEQVERLCAEVTLVCAAAGFTTTAAGVKQSVSEVITSTADNRSSMLQDVLSGRPTEIDFITGYLLQVATQYTLDAPFCSELLKRIQNRDR